MWEGKDLAGLADTSYDIIPFRYCLSRDILVPFWELREEDVAWVLASEADQALAPPLACQGWFGPSSASSDF